MVEIRSLIVCVETIQYYANLLSIPVFSVTINIIKRECNFFLVKTFYQRPRLKYNILVFLFMVKSMIAIWQRLRIIPVNLFLIAFNLYVCSNLQFMRVCMCTNCGHMHLNTVLLVGNEA